jgi:hypothetical protein
MKKSISVTCALLMMEKIAQADAIPYSKVSTLVANESSLICIHEHDYSKGLPEKPPVKINDYDSNMYYFEKLGHVYCQMKEKKLFKVDSPPFSDIYVKNKIFIGISNVKRGNNVQYMALSATGEILLRGHISEDEICLTQQEWQDFMISDKDAKVVIPYSTNVNGIIHLDITSRFNRQLFWPNSSSKYINFGHRCSSHISPFFHGTVSNYIYWYDEQNPNPSVDYNSEKKTWQLRIKDPTGVYIYVP